MEYIDECGFWINLRPRKGFSKRGKRCVSTSGEPLSQKYTVVAAVDMYGISGF